MVMCIYPCRPVLWFSLGVSLLFPLVVSGCFEEAVLSTHQATMVFSCGSLREAATSGTRAVVKGQRLVLSHPESFSALLRIPLLHANASLHGRPLAVVLNQTLAAEVPENSQYKDSDPLVALSDGKQNRIGLRIVDASENHGTLRIEQVTEGTGKITPTLVADKIRHGQPLRVRFVFGSESDSGVVVDITDGDGSSFSVTLTNNLNVATGLEYVLYNEDHHETYSIENLAITLDAENADWTKQGIPAVRLPIIRNCAGQPSGEYLLDLHNNGNLVRAKCNNDIDGGGWLAVASFVNDDEESKWLSGRQSSMITSGHFGSVSTMSVSDYKSRAWNSFQAHDVLFVDEHGWLAFLTPLAERSMQQLMTNYASAACWITPIVDATRHRNLVVASSHLWQEHAMLVPFAAQSDNQLACTLSMPAPANSSDLALVANGCGSFGAGSPGNDWTVNLGGASVHATEGCGPWYGLNGLATAQPSRFGTVFARGCRRRVDCPMGINCPCGFVIAYGVLDPTNCAGGSRWAKGRLVHEPRCASGEMMAVDDFDAPRDEHECNTRRRVWVCTTSADAWQTAGSNHTVHAGALSFTGDMLFSDPQTEHFNDTINAHLSGHRLDLFPAVDSNTPLLMLRRKIASAAPAEMDVFGQQLAVNVTLDMVDLKNASTTYIALSGKQWRVAVGVGAFASHSELPWLVDNALWVAPNQRPLEITVVLQHGQGRLAVKQVYPNQPRRPDLLAADVFADLLGVESDMNLELWATGQTAVGINFVQASWTRKEVPLTSTTHTTTSTTSEATTSTATTTTSVTTTSQTTTTSTSSTSTTPQFAGLIPVPHDWRYNVAENHGLGDLYTGRVVGRSSITTKLTAADCTTPLVSFAEMARNHSGMRFPSFGLGLRYDASTQFLTLQINRTVAAIVRHSFEHVCIVVSDNETSSAYRMTVHLSHPPLLQVPAQLSVNCQCSADTQQLATSPVFDPVIEPCKRTPDGYAEVAECSVRCKGGNCHAFPFQARGCALVPACNVTCLEAKYKVVFEAVSVNGLVTTRELTLHVRKLQPLSNNVIKIIDPQSKDIAEGEKFPDLLLSIPGGPKLISHLSSSPFFAVTQPKDGSMAVTRTEFLPKFDPQTTVTCLAKSEFYSSQPSTTTIIEPVTSTTSATMKTTLTTSTTTPTTTATTTTTDIAADAQRETTTFLAAVLSSTTMTQSTTAQSTATTTRTHATQTTTTTRNTAAQTTTTTHATTTTRMTTATTRMTTAGPLSTARTLYTSAAPTTTPVEERVCFNEHSVAVVVEYSNGVQSQVCVKIRVTDEDETPVFAPWFGPGQHKHQEDDDGNDDKADDTKSYILLATSSVLNPGDYGKNATLEFQIVDKQQRQIFELLTSQKEGNVYCLKLLVSLEQAQKLRNNTVFNVSVGAYAPGTLDSGQTLVLSQATVTVIVPASKLTQASAPAGAGADQRENWTAAGIGGVVALIVLIVLTAFVVRKTKSVWRRRQLLPTEWHSEKAEYPIVAGRRFVSCSDKAKTEFRETVMEKLEQLAKKNGFKFVPIFKTVTAGEGKGGLRVDNQSDLSPFIAVDVPGSNSKWSKVRAGLLRAGLKHQQRAEKQVQVGCRIPIDSDNAHLRGDAELFVFSFTPKKKKGEHVIDLWLRAKQDDNLRAFDLFEMAFEETKSVLQLLEQTSEKVLDLEETSWCSLEEVPTIPMQHVTQSLRKSDKCFSIPMSRERALRLTGAMPLRLLVVRANSLHDHLDLQDTDQPASMSLNTDMEAECISAQELKADPRMNISILSMGHVSLKNLRQRICQFQPHWVHFMGHALNDGNQIVLVGERGDPSVVKTEEFVAELKKTQAHCLRGMVLNCCYGANVAKALVAAEVVSVGIGASGVLSDSVALAFATTFWEAAFQGQPLQECFEEASRASRVEGKATPESVTKYDVHEQGTCLLGVPLCKKTSVIAPASDEAPTRDVAQPPDPAQETPDNPTQTQPGIVVTIPASDLANEYDKIAPATDETGC